MTKKSKQSRIWDRLTLKQNIYRGLRKILPPMLVRLIYRRYIFRYINKLHPDYNPARKTILAINHFYNQDLRALINANRKYNIVIINGPELSKVNSIYFSLPVRQMKVPYESELPENRALYRQECRLILDRLERRFHPRLLVTGSDNYCFVRELIAAARERSLPTLVLDKEGILSPYYFEAGVKLINELVPFMSDHIFVWSERQRQFWKKVGVAENEITVIGQPRSDLFYQEQNRCVDRYFPTSKPLITLFSYEDIAYIPIAVLHEGVSWKEMKQQTHDYVFSLAQKHPEYNFVIKTHPQQSDLNELQSAYQLDNLAVIGGASVANELIQRSELIIAFQTTADLEAMLMKKRIIYTAWDRHYPRFRNDVLPYHDACGLVIADTYGHFQQVCERFFAGDYHDFELSHEAVVSRDKFVEGYLHKPDGHVCERFFEAVERFVK